jgi:hypothetical protein
MNTKNQEQQAQDQENDESESMLAGFDAIRGGSYSASDDRKSPDVEKDTSTDDDSGEEDQADDEEQEAPVFAGLTESQLKSILERATRVDAIEDQLRKANGKIGELNGTLQEIQRRRPTQHAPADDLDDEQIAEFESTFPEFGPAVEARARKIAQEVMQSQQAQGQRDPEEISKQVNLAVMNTTHKGWQQTTASDDFKLWIASQPPDVQQTFQTTWDAQELGGIVTAFKSRQQAASARSTKSKQRLEAALTPDGRSSKVVHAVTEQDAMQAGFDAVRTPRFYNTR